MTSSEMETGDRLSKAECYAFRWSAPGEPYLARLRRDYGLDDIVGRSAHDHGKVKAIAAWAHRLWQHHGDSTPTSPDAITILEEAREGKRFRCVEYAIVISSCLTAVGVPARFLALKTEDVETRPTGAGHCVAEAYLRDQAKWVMADGQWDVIPMLGERPLNAVEFRDALAQGSPELALDGSSGAEAEEYLRWVAPYLFYFDVPLDNRIGVPDCSPTRLMLVPRGAKKPTVFQQRFPMEDMVYTHSVRAFYPVPG
jgi:hypothetical protein